jgi:hypothetical protein
MSEKFKVGDTVKHKVTCLRWKVAAIENKDKAVCARHVTSKNKREMYIHVSVFKFVELKKA